MVIAWALAPQPENIIADEPISSLDVSNRAEIVVLNTGKVVEQGAAKHISTQPRDAYARLLLEAIPKLDVNPVIA